MEISEFFPLLGMAGSSYDSNDFLYSWPSSPIYDAMTHVIFRRLSANERCFSSRFTICDKVRCMVWCGVVCQQRLTEKNLKHQIPFDKKMFTKSENSFRMSHKRRKHKGLLRTRKARMTRKRARSQGKEHGSQAPLAATIHAGRYPSSTVHHG